MAHGEPEQPLVKLGPGIYVEPATETLHIDAAEVCAFFDVEPTPDNCEVVERYAREVVGDVLIDVREDAGRWR